MPGVKGFSPTNLKYMSYFYKLYAPLAANRQQAADDFEEDLYKTDIQRVGDKKQNRLHGVDDFKFYSLFHGFIINVSSTNARMIWTKPCSS